MENWKIKEVGIDFESARNDYGLISADCIVVGEEDGEETYDSRSFSFDPYRDEVAINRILDGDTFSEAEYAEAETLLRENVLSNKETLIEAAKPLAEDASKKGNKEIQRLKDMIEAGEDVTACVALYLDLYEDTDVMHRDIVEDEIEALRAGDDEDNMVAGRLELMLRDNPNATYFDYYVEEPITIDWLRKRLGMGKDPKKTVNLLKFLQNMNIIRIRNNEEFNRFRDIMLRRGLTPLVKGWAQNYPAQVFQTVKFNNGIDRPIESGEWDGKTFYAECQIGKESIGIYPYTYRTTVEWYGADPMSVDDIDDKGI